MEKRLSVAFLLPAYCRLFEKLMNLLKIEDSNNQLNLFSILFFNDYNGNY